MEIGDRVEVLTTKYDNEEYFYCGTVLEVNDTNIKIKFDAGMVDAFPKSCVRGTDNGGKSKYSYNRLHNKYWR